MINSDSINILLDIDQDTIPFDQPMILDFWHSQCYWCLKGFEDTEKLLAKKADTDKPLMIGINLLDVDEGMVRLIIDQFQLSYPQVMDADHLAKQLNIQAYPTFVLMSPDGTVHDRLEGYDPRRLKAMLRKARSMRK